MSDAPLLLDLRNSRWLTEDYNLMLEIHERDILLRHHKYVREEKMMGFPKWTRTTIVVLVGMSLAALACVASDIAQLAGGDSSSGGGNSGGSGLPEPPAIPEIGGDDVSLAASDTCPVLKNADVQTITGRTVTLNTVVDTPVLLGCGFTFENQDIVAVSVYILETPELAQQYYDIYARPPGNTAVDVTGSWEIGSYSAEGGLFFKTQTNMVSVIYMPNDQTTLMQLANVIASHLPYVSQQ